MVSDRQVPPGHALYAIYISNASPERAVPGLPPPAADASAADAVMNDDNDNTNTNNNRSNNTDDNNNGNNNNNNNNNNDNNGNEDDGTNDNDDDRRKRRRGNNEETASADEIQEILLKFHDGVNTTALTYQIISAMYSCLDQQDDSFHRGDLFLIPTNNSTVPQPNEVLSLADFPTTAEQFRSFFYLKPLNPVPSGNQYSWQLYVKIRSTQHASTFKKRIMPTL